MLTRELEACKLSSNLRAASGIHARITKLNYGAYQSLLPSLTSIYVSCGFPNLARQLLKEIPCWDFDLTSANLVIAISMKVGETDIANKGFASKSHNGCNVGPSPGDGSTKSISENRVMLSASINIYPLAIPSPCGCLLCPDRCKSWPPS
ncbi:hypothetical protein U1Q18_041738 [Sarracenia purpurea var. burkii]